VYNRLQELGFASSSVAIKPEYLFTGLGAPVDKPLIFVGAP